MWEKEVSPAEEEKAKVKVQSRSVYRWRQGWEVCFRNQNTQPLEKSSLLHSYWSSGPLVRYWSLHFFFQKITFTANYHTQLVFHEVFQLLVTDQRWSEAFLLSLLGLIDIGGPFISMPFEVPPFLVCPHPLRRLLTTKRAAGSCGQSADQYQRGDKKKTPWPRLKGSIYKPWFKIMIHPPTFPNQFLVMTNWYKFVDFLMNLGQDY